MRAKLYVPFAFMALSALIWMSPTGPISKISAQQPPAQPGAQPAAQPAGRGQPGAQPGGRGQGQGKQGGGGFGRGGTPTFAGPPAGMQALPQDLFLSKNFYKDEKLWSDQRYFRCNTPRQLTDIWTSRRIGDKAPASASWGDCSQDYPREKIVSPYPYKTAKEHYGALLAAAKAKAKTIACASNEKQIALGYLLYAGDCNDFLPVAGSFTTGIIVLPTEWYREITPYLAQIAASNSTEPSESPYQVFCTALQIDRLL